VTLLPSTALDLRSDEEIISELVQNKPITTEKNIWAFWDKGFKNCPAWNQRNVISWVRRLGPEWTIRVLDLVPGSALHVDNFLDFSWFPKSYKDNNMNGPYVPQVQSDFVRFGLLYLYGGIWMDVGTLIFRHLDDIWWNVLDDANTPYTVGAFALEEEGSVNTIMNGVIAAKKGDEFIKRWHQIYLEMWKGNSNTVEMHKHPLVKHLGLLGRPAGIVDDSFWTPERSAGWTDYLVMLQALKRLRFLVDSTDGFNGAEYFESHFYLLDFCDEFCYFQIKTQWDGYKQFEVLATKQEAPSLDADDSLKEGYQNARSIAEHIVARASCLKISHGIEGAQPMFLGRLWDKPENRDADVWPGTFAAYLRYAMLHFQQTRSVEPLKITPAKKVYRARLTEEFEAEKEEGNTKV
jgi:hypothetical protein